MNNQIKHLVRDEKLFAGIRKPIKSRKELIPRIEEVTKLCGDAAVGPLQHIIRYDTPTDGIDSEVGYQVTREINEGDVRTHKLRKLYFFTLVHKGPQEELRDTKIQILNHMNACGLSQELEDIEIFNKFDSDDPEKNEFESQISYLAWPEIYKEQLIRVLGNELADEIWAGGENITPFTLVDERVKWVGRSIEKLKMLTNSNQQFDILSRVALVRPEEDVSKFKKIFSETGDLNQVIETQDQELKKTSFGGFIDPHWSDGKVLHLSKVSYSKKAYDAAKNHTELRKAYCFCSLIREAKAPEVDPIFCFRAAGWARQFWEPILGTKFKECKITSSILKGDKFCSWEYEIPKN